MLTFKNIKNELVLSFIFFLVLMAYYLMRPLRDEMGIQAGIENLPHLFSLTMLATLILIPLFGLLCTYVDKYLIGTVSYVIIAIQIVIFYFLFASGWSHKLVASLYFVWLSVCNLFLVSIFWTVVVDRYSSFDAKRTFGLISAGGTLGGLVGPILSGFLAMYDPLYLLILSACLIGIAGVLMLKNSFSRRSTHENQEERLIFKNDIWSGLRAIYASNYCRQIALFFIFNSICSTIIYLTQLKLMEHTIPDSIARTSLFAWIDAIVNSITLVAQLLVTSRLLTRMSIKFNLLLLPVCVFVSFLLGLVAPVLFIIVATHIARRIINYAITKPSREILFTSLNTEEKYRVKNVIDLFIYRLGDAIGSWMFGLATFFSPSLLSPIFAGLCSSTLWIFQTKYLSHLFRLREGDNR